VLMLGEFDQSAQCAFGQMLSASEQLMKRMAFDQMRNVWPNARAFGQIHHTFGQMCSD